MKLINYIIAILCLIAFTQAYAQEDEIDKLLSDNDSSFITMSHTDDDTDYEFKVIQKIDLKSLNIPDCNDVSLVFNRCVPATCSVKAPYGTIIAKIKGMKNDQCEYIERTEKVSGLNCAFSLESANDLEKAFTKRFQKLEALDNGNLFSTEELTTIEDFLTNSCQTVLDYALIKKVSISKSSIIAEQDPELSNLNDIEKEKTIGVDIPSGDKKSPIKAKTVTLQTFETILLSNTEYALLSKVLEGFKDSDDASGRFKTYLRTGNGIFYLDSLIYYTPDKWTLWINGTKYDSSKPINDQLSIEKVHPKYIELKWVTYNIEKASPRWKDILLPVSDTKYASKSNSIFVEFVENSEEAKVYFELRPNQTFDSATMSVFEGK